VNDPGIISYKWYDFGVDRSKVKVTGSQVQTYVEGDRVAGESYAELSSANPLQGAAKKTYHDKNSDFLKTVL